jgi:hypothetical protein
MKTEMQFAEKRHPIKNGEQLTSEQMAETLE